MAENKTQLTGESVAELCATIEPASRRADAERLHALFQSITGEAGDVWTGGIVGYGRCTYRYASGKEGVWMWGGFAARRTGLTVYLMAGAERDPALLARLGPHTTGASCLYLKRLDGIDEEVLGALIRSSLAAMGRGEIYRGA